jgi:hypothetical protein
MNCNVYYRKYIYEKQCMKNNLNTVHAHTDTNINFWEVLKKKQKGIELEMKSLEKELKFNTCYEN